MRLFIFAVLIIFYSTFLIGCTHVSYLGQSVAGQIDIWQAEEPVSDLINDETTNPILRQRLMHVADILEFAHNEIDLPDNGSYSNYADIKKPFVVWNVFATPRFDLTPKTWCYPIVGCQAYRGYFEKQKAVTFAQNLSSQNYDVIVGGVSAYSTLGWFEDPLLNTFIHWGDEDLAGLIFHELSHQVVFIKDDTTFNESFATAVEIEALEKWFKFHQQSDAIVQMEARQALDVWVTDLIRDYRAQLSALYKSIGSDLNVPDHAMGDVGLQDKKQAIFERMRFDYHAFKSQHEFDDIRLSARWDKWFEQDLNNANMISVGAYYDDVPFFRAMFDNCQQDFKLFYESVKRMAKKLEKKGESKDTRTSDCLM